MCSVLNPAPINEIYERWIDKYERHRLRALSEIEERMQKGAEEMKQAVARK